MPADYTALKAAWGTTGLPAGVTGTALASGMTPQQKLAAMQGWQVAGPLQDVPVGKIAGYLMRTGKWLALEVYAASPPAGAAAVAIAGAKMLAQICNNQSPIPTFEMSDAQTASELNAMLGALVADTNTGLVAADQTTMVGYATSASLSWDRAPVASGGAGLPSALTAMDLTAAKLATSTDFPGA